MLYCPNPTCQAQNPEGSRYCQQCRTPLPHRYLWAVTTAEQLPPPGQLLADRYLHKGQSIFLDTLPGYPPSTDAEQVPAVLFAYLRLVGWRPHIPLVYDLAFTTTNEETDRVLLLEEAALWEPPRVRASDNTAESSTPPIAPLPAIATFWEKMLGTRQLTWLWQLATLWQPLLAENVASTLLRPDLIRVEGALVRLLELTLDNPEKPPTLADLGQVWQQWQDHAHPEVLPFLQTLTEAMVNGDIEDASVLVEQLDEELAIASRSQPRHIAIATATDQGPTRARNEDACYPPSGSVQSHLLDENTDTFPMAIVCDGIGGHQGGDVASNLAISTLYQEIQARPIDNFSPNTLIDELITSIGVVNDAISERNDNESRLERQRMGTTLVMALLKHHELYIGHVGDSRAYWVTRWNCHQLTLDDDVASRQVRLGQSLYRQALQYPGAGSLVQALGMSHSRLLRPTVQRFLLDEDGVLLLCSDGLSDADRIENGWDREILPILQSERSLEEGVQRLVEIANTLNGHDNVTIALMHCRVPHTELDQLLLHKAHALVRTHLPSGTAAAASDPSATTPPEATQVVAPQTDAPSAAKRPLPWLLSLGIVAVICAGLIYLLWPRVQQQLLGESDAPAPDTTAASSEESTAELQYLLAGNFVQVGQLQTDDAALPTLSVQFPPTPGANRTLLPNSILQIVDTQDWDGQTWLQLRVCTVGTVATPEEAEERPNPPPASAPLAEWGDVGWLPEADALNLTRSISAEAVPPSVCDNPLSPDPAPSPDAETPPLG